MIAVIKSHARQAPNASDDAAGDRDPGDGEDRADELTRQEERVGLDRVLPPRPHAPRARAGGAVALRRAVGIGVRRMLCVLRHRGGLLLPRDGLAHRSVLPVLKPVFCMLLKPDPLVVQRLNP
jgi:hypothetical protein